MGLLSSTCSKGTKGASGYPTRSYICCRVLQLGAVTWEFPSCDSHSVLYAGFSVGFDAAAESVDLESSSSSSARATQRERERGLINRSLQRGVKLEIRVAR